MPARDGAGPGRRLVHQRQVICRGYERDDGLWDIEGELIDTKPFELSLPERGLIEAGEPIHRMTLRLAVDLRLVIHEAEACMYSTPYRVCPGITSAYTQLAGMQIGPGFVLSARKRLRRVSGCTHLTELIGHVATVAYQTLWDRMDNPDGGNEENKPAEYAFDGCHALDRSGELVRRLFPEFYRPSGA